MNLQTFYMILAVVAVFFGVYVLFALSHHGWRKIVAPMIFGCVLIALGATSMLALGLPRPLWTYKVSHGYYHLIGWTFIEKKAIYIWCEPEGDGDPVVVQLPWSEEKASELQQAMDQVNSGQTMDIDLGDLARNKEGATVTPTTSHAIVAPMKPGN